MEAHLDPIGYMSARWMAHAAAQWHQEGHVIDLAGPVISPNVLNLNIKLVSIRSESDRIET